MMSQLVQPCPAFAELSFCLQATRGFIVFPVLNHHTIIHPYTSDLLPPIWGEI